MRLLRQTGWVVTLVVALVMTGCARIPIHEYKDNKPKLVLEQFFNGSMQAHGIVENRHGKVIRYFNVTIDAHWKDGVGTLEEHFVYNDGSTGQRIWTLKRVGDNHYIGTAGDIVGQADIQVAGNAMYLNYVLRLPYKNGTIDLAIDDRMYLVEPGVLINESRMSKWGFGVGRILLVIERGDY